MKTRKLLIITASVLFAFIGGCVAEGLVAAANRDNLNRLEIGMTKDEVLKIMGKPYQREASEQCEWWFYLTHADAMYGSFNIDSEKTPLAFENSRLIGWGRNFYIEKTRKYDVKIDQTIKQN
jgi:outer membrane protein assembly factor BamE (lipoprotein component of BamABCDE complex)